MPQITVPLDEPFSLTDSSTSTSLPASVIGIAGRAYLMDTLSGQYGRQGIDVVQQRNTSDNRDLLLLPQDVWRQMSQSWHQGSGQSNVDRDDALPYRYANSYGVNPWDRWGVSLLKATGGPAGDFPVYLATHGGYMVAGSEKSLFWWDDPTHSPAEVTVGTSNIISMTYDGDNVITLAANGDIYYASGPSASATHLYKSEPNSTFISYVKDYLIVGKGNKLVNITAPVDVDIYTSPVTGFRWVGACEGNTEIYVLGGAGDKHVIHRVGIKDDGTGLKPAAVAASLPDGETGYSIGSYLGYVFIGTDKGVRMAILSSNIYTTTGNLTLGAILPTTQPVYGFEGQDRFVWFTNSDITAPYASLERGESALFPATNVCGLSRMDLSTFTITDATPAYAPDLSAATITGAIVRSVATFNDKRIFAIDGEGVWYETSDLVPAGWITQGDISFSVEDLKTALYMQGKWLPLKGTIAFDLSYDSSGYSRISEFTTQGTIRSTNINLNGAQFSRVSPRIVLKRSVSDHTIGPTFTRWEIRAIPVKGQASRWQLPIMNYDEVYINGVPEKRDVLAELDTLMLLYESGTVFTLLESGRSYRVHAKDFLWKPEKLSHNGLGWQGVYTLIVEETK
jgi:hypothetical protein